MSVVSSLCRTSLTVSSALSLAQLPRPSKAYCDGDLLSYLVSLENNLLLDWVDYRLQKCYVVL